jgi:uncharacterized LabA/DUF88 family protein/cold shock CspA family protein
MTSIKKTQGMTRVAVFYDGNYFLHVSNYYNYVHERRSRISIRGLHEFIRHQIATESGIDVPFCQIVDAHYFRGRLVAAEASQRGDLLYYERVFDDVLMSEGITTHYLPIKGISGRKVEKGIDVWLALEAFELALYKQFDVLVLIASDSDYIPLIRKLNTLGTQVMVLGWDFDYTDEEGNKYSTRTAQDLLEEVTYPIPMHLIIDSKARKDEPLVNNLFVPKVKDKVTTRPDSEEGEDGESEPNFNLEWHESSILSLKEGFGFIKYPPNNVFFHYTSLKDYDFNDLELGDEVKFTLVEKEGGRLVALQVIVTQEQEDED